ncbi:MAG: hypothetical protein ACK6DP_14530 [Gemmatimonas sp.]|uniref:hypothetical protein n=1 Tax=Gemmatimonas sp. TaxID=1962908 RepID=UPI00391F5BAC|nr:hypothetical protein [Gemmatimonadota bacterium]
MMPSLRSSVRQAALAVCLVVAAPVSAVRAQSAAATATFLDYRTAVPAGWTASSPSSSMRLAEYRVPGANGAAPVEIVVYFFGPGQGGTPEANLARWKSQFSNPDGSPVAGLVRRDSTGAFPLTIAEYRGTYARGVGMGSSASEARPGHLLLAVVAETPRGTLFFQCFGPMAAVEAQRATYLQFVKGLR